MLLGVTELLMFLLYLDEQRVSKVAGLLREASEVLESISENQERIYPGSSSSTATGTIPQNHGNTSVTARAAIAETLTRARSMMQSSSNAGLYRRLNRNERLRAAAEGFTPSTRNQPVKSKKEKKPRTSSNLLC